MGRLLIALVLMMLSLSLCSAGEPPVVLIFPVTAGEGATPAMAGDATQAIKTYLRQIGKAEPVEFDAQSVMVRRAMMEHRINSDDLVGVTTPEARLRLGKLLETDFVATGEITIKDHLSVSIWLGNVKNRQVSRFEGVSPVGRGGDRDRDVYNAIQTAVSGAIHEMAGVVLKDIKPDAQLAEVSTSEATDLPATAAPAVDPVMTTQAAPDDPAAHIALAEGFERSGDTASAILEYRRAINIDPKNVQIRLKLAQLYVARQMIVQAREALERAMEIDPENEAVKAELVKLLDRQAEPSRPTVAETTPRVEQAPRSRKESKDVISLLAAGDHYWRQKALSEAEKHYRQAIAIDDASVLAHERLALLLLAQAKFDDARREIDRTFQLDPKPDKKTSDERYARFHGVVDQHLKALLSRYETESSAFSSKRRTREDYYQRILDISSLAESMTKFYEFLTSTQENSSMHKRKILGLSLLSQSCAHELNYLETNRTTERDDARIMLGEARKYILSAK